MGVPDGTRTPSPTPSEEAALAKTSIFDWKAMANWRFWLRREWLWYYVAGAVALVLIILFTAFHTKIVNWLQPAANWMHKLPAGWLIPIAILFVISFPPLFGHEIIAILAGLVWGLWEGFGIVAAGTLIGELGNFYAFRYCCSARGQKLERSELSYACLARIVRDGGFKIALIARFSAIPGHFTTAVFSTCGMSVWTFTIAAIFSLPKQFITVYLGVALEQSQNGSNSSKSNIIKDVVLIITIIITFVAMWYIYHRMNQVKPLVIYDRRKARQTKILAAAYETPYDPASEPFNPDPSTTSLNRTNDMHQQWDSSGRAVGYVGDASVYAPSPRRAQPQQQQQQNTKASPHSASAVPSPSRNPYRSPVATPPISTRRIPPPPVSAPAASLYFDNATRPGAAVTTDVGDMPNPFTDLQRIASPRSYALPMSAPHSPPSAYASVYEPAPAYAPAARTLTPAQFAALRAPEAPQGGVHTGVAEYSDPYAAYEGGGAGVR
ncbi:snare associated Golgi protein-domain-containing protein [Sparassis latifolia]